jgi:hypothetical protein
MIAGDKSLRVTGVQHVATKNSVTLKVRIFLTDAEGNDYCFDAEALTFELYKLAIKGGPDIGILNDGVAK